MSKFKVLITDYVWPTTEPEEAVRREEADAEAVVAPDGSEETLISLAGDVDAIMTCFAQVTPNVLRAAPNCVAVGRFGVGVDNIAVDTATELGMAVTYVPDYCVDEVSDHVMALLLTWNRRVALFDNSVKGEGWGSVPLTMRMMRLRGKTIGIIGFGRIGQAVAQKALAFGMRVLASDPLFNPQTAALRGALRGHRHSAQRIGLRDASRAAQPAHPEHDRRARAGSDEARILSGELRARRPD